MQNINTIIYIKLLTYCCSNWICLTSTVQLRGIDSERLTGESCLLFQMGDFPSKYYPEKMNNSDTIKILILFMNVGSCTPAVHTHIHSRDWCLGQTQDLNMQSYYFVCFICTWRLAAFLSLIGQSISVWLIPNNATFNIKHVLYAVIIPNVDF